MNHPIKNESSVTPLSYLREILASSWRHNGELVVAAVCVVGVGLAALLTRSLLNLRAFGPGEVLFLFLPPLGAVLMFEAAVAGWRLHRRQQVALATTRSLLELNAADRDDLEQQLRSRYRRREARIHQMHAARVERLSDEIATLHHRTSLTPTAAA